MFFPRKTVLGFDDPSLLGPVNFSGDFAVKHQGPYGFFIRETLPIFFVAFPNSYPPLHRLYGVCVHLARLGTGGSPLAEIP